MLQAQEPSTYTGYVFLKNTTFCFNWSALVGVRYKTGPVECEGRAPLCQVSAPGPARHGALWWAGFTPSERATGQTVAHREEVPEAYSLAMAKGFSTSIFPQSATITSFRGLSRPSVLVLSTFRTTSWEGRHKQGGTVGQESTTHGRQAPARGGGGGGRY